MATFLCATKGNSNPQGKPRVYFTCHPEDFARYFDKIREDIFKTHDCAIYYTQDMTEVIADEDKATDLGQMNLFVVPVTFRLLSQPNRAMDDDIAYAKQQHVPILPLMMETGIDEFYGKPDKFGELQYLSPYSQDKTAIAYKDKLKKYLNSILISDKTAKRIRAAFDAYIFLSYRKKDRRYANTLMKLIHKNPEYRDIAIWYDEFLTPGESFRKNIKKMMSNSKLFALLVTPSLFEYVDGKPNYVMKHEYPDARKKGMDILPAEMQKTDKALLGRKFKGIPDCINPSDDELFKDRLAQTLSKIAISENNEDPEHNFLIGLAYLDGIDVEVDRERGLQLITSAAEDGLVEAMEKLYDMYYDGIDVRINYDEAVKWGNKVADYYTEHNGEKSVKTLTALNRLACAYISTGNWGKALELFEKVYNCEKKRRGKKHKHTLGALNNLAYAYKKHGEIQKALEMHQKAHALGCEVLGEDHRSTLVSLNNIAMIYIDIPNGIDKALELNKKAYRLRRKKFGVADSDTILSLSNLAYTYAKLNKPQIALKLYKKAYELCLIAFGETAHNTMQVLNNLANIYSELEQYVDEIKIRKKAFVISFKIFGKDSLNTMLYMRELAMAYYDNGEYNKYVHLLERLHFLSCKMFDEKHPLSLQLLVMISMGYGKLGNEQKRREIMEIYRKYSL